MGACDNCQGEGKVVLAPLMEQAYRERENAISLRRASDAARATAEREHRARSGRCSKCGRQAVLRDEFRSRNDQTDEVHTIKIKPLCDACYGAGGYWRGLDVKGN